MENIIDGGCTQSDLILNVKKKTFLFKDGTELIYSVNKMDVDVFEDKDDKFETLVVSISLVQQQCNKEI